MAKETSSETKPPGHKKLPKLPSSQKIQKRPLLHAPITAPLRGASSPKFVYISTSTPFIATVKRVQKLLSHVEDRASGPLSISGGDKKLLKGIQTGIKGKGDGKVDSRSKVREEEVVMKATGKAIEKLLRLAIWWQGQEGVVVRIRTGTVGAVDDIVERGGEDGEGIVEGSRVRRASCLEVSVRLR